MCLRPSSSSSTKKLCGYANAQQDSAVEAYGMQAGKRRRCPANTGTSARLSIKTRCDLRTTLLKSTSGSCFKWSEATCGSVVREKLVG